MKCPTCNYQLKSIAVSVHGAATKAISYQCPSCDYFSFEPTSSGQVLSELRESPLRMKQRIVKLSQDRLGIYFNKNLVESLDIKKGESIFVSVPDKKHIILELA